MLQTFVDALTANQISFLIQEPLSRHTTFRVGGNCAAMVLPTTQAQVVRTIQLLKQHHLRYRIIGNGSNILASDDGYDGVILLLHGNYATVTQLDDHTIQADAGAMLTAVCNHAMQQGLTGLEFAYGIPGTIGGGVYMNAGAYGGELADVVQSVTYLETDGTVVTKSADALDFSYRHSYFSHSDKIVLSATFSLKAGDKQTIQATMTDILSRRREKQPLEYPSAGSTFKRPEGYFAGKLIQDAGLKGYSVGGAQVSEKHAGFVINRADATASDIKQLMAEITTKVEAQFGVTLHPEVELLER